MPFPALPKHSRWEILEETEPGFFRVRCTCDRKVEKTLARRYVRGESLSCGCLVSEKAREQGKRNLSPLRRGYQQYVESIDSDNSRSKYSAKLPNLEIIMQHKQQGLSNLEIAHLYGSTRQAVQKRLSKNVTKLQLSQP